MAETFFCCSAVSNADEHSQACPEVIYYNYIGIIGSRFT